MPSRMRQRLQRGLRNSAHTSVVRAVREDDIYVVHLEAFKTLLRSFDNAVGAGGDRSQLAARTDSAQYSQGPHFSDSLFPGQAHIVRPAATPEQLGSHDEIRPLHIEFLENATPGKLSRG